MQQKGKLYLLPSFLNENTSELTVVEFAKKIISELDYFLVENIKTARRFIKTVQKDKNIDASTFEIINKDTSPDEVLNLVLPILNGTSAAVISEAGAPGIADPGALVVEMCHQNSIEVVPIVGASSIFLALMASGLNGQGFTFHGYLPIDKNSRKLSIKSIENEALKSGYSQIFMETPYRNKSLLDDVLSNCKPLTLLTLACDLHSENQLIKTTSIEKWRQKKPDIHKKPCIFIIGK